MLLANRVLELYLNGELLDGYDIDVSYSFEAESKNPAEASITIYNYKDLAIEGGDVIIKAGYEDNVYQVFEGTITEASVSVDQGVNTLSLKVVNSFLEYRRVIEPSKIPKGTSLKDYIAKVAKKAGFKLGTLDLPSININRDMSVYKYPMEIIKNLADSYSFYFIIDNSKTLHCYSSPSNTATLLNSSTGLLKYSIKWTISNVQKKVLVPDKKNPPKKSRKTDSNTNKNKLPKEGTYFTANCLFIPTLALNHKIVLEDSSVNIKYEGMITKMSVNLSNYSDTWYTDLSEVKVL